MSADNNATATVQLTAFEKTKGQVVLDAIRAIDGDVYYRDLARDLGFEHGHTAAFLSGLRKRGLVTSDGAGRWRAVRNNGAAGRVNGSGSSVREEQGDA